MELYKELRPTTLDEVFGNKQLKQSFINSIQGKNRPHVYMLTGSTGCGKTTLALIAAKMLGVSDPTRLYDINASDANGVEDVREINRVIQYYSQQPRAFIIDEAQKYTEQAWSALLKTMEGELNNTYFFFCTTNPEQICGTKPEMHGAVMNRCVQYQVEPLSLEESFQLLQWANEKKALNVAPEVLFEVAKVAEGISRQALQLLSSVVGLDVDTAKERLSKADTVMETVEDKNADIFAVCKKIILTACSWADVRGDIKTLRDNKKGAETLRIMLLRYASTCALNGTVNQRVLTVNDYFNTPYYDAATAWSVCILDCAAYFNENKR